ncbi:MAG: hypothetical protein R3B70_04180 [Polyangiaceae bacterium]
MVDPSGPALILTDPEVLARVPLERIVSGIASSFPVALTAEETMQRLFDSMNDTASARFPGAWHCDDPGVPNADTVPRSDPVACPRAEGVLADNTHFFEDGHPDSFMPVAIVNRFDLTPFSGVRCGEYRVVYAKRSGLTDPNDRVFLIFEAALQNPDGCVEACRSIAEGWLALQGLSPTAQADWIDNLFFTGHPGFMPLARARSFGVDPTHGYSDTAPGGGQVRVALHMQEPWSMRELVVAQEPDEAFGFVPTTVKNSPPASFFSPTGPLIPAAELRKSFTENHLPSLVAGDLLSIEMFNPSTLDGLESPLSGPGANDYEAAATSGPGSPLLATIDAYLTKNAVGTDCPAGDPLDAAAVLRRATTQSCAGCHAPTALLGETRSLGCGLTWPASHGETHINEKGELSPALKDLFLPHRAEVLQTFLQSCDPAAIDDNLLAGNPADAPESAAKLLPSPRTLGGSLTH